MKTWMRQAVRRQRTGKAVGTKRLGEAVQADGEWLDSLPWEWFATFTLPDGIADGIFLGCHETWTGRI